MFLPGQSGNKNGRPKGSLNKRTRAEKPIKQWFRDKNIHPLDLIMQCLNKQKSVIDLIDDPIEQFKAYNEVTKRAIDILPYVAPKLKEIEDTSEPADITAEYSETIDKASSEELLKMLRSV